MGIVKNERELQIMRENAKVHKEVFEEIKKIAKPGITGYDIDKLAGDICKKYNVLCGFKGVYNFPANLCISVNSCVVHGVPSKKMIFQDGDVVKFDFGVKDKKHGLNTDAAFTMIIGDGPYSIEVKRFLQVSQEALYKGVAKAIVGNKVGDIGNAIQKHIESNGYFIVKDLTGHGIGYNLHEKPYIPNFGKAGTGEMLKENMTIAIEPIIGFSSGKIKDKGGFEIYIADGSLGAQFEHTIVVKPNYPEIIV
ncbi:MAG: type I methionyl aminopeptidase [Candidatus Gracilibacteria bacterium]|nr:type I methionyl aminopeptidase [Candidatus Gracilibacteria bacterium]